MQSRFVNRLGTSAMAALATHAALSISPGTARAQAAPPKQVNVMAYVNFLRVIEECVANK